MAEVALPTQVARILDWWYERVQSVLGAKVESVVLYGSATLGDFVPGWSDVDVCTVLDEPVSGTEAAELGAVHDEMAERFIAGGQNGWRSGQAVEGPYMPAALAGDAGAAAPCYKAGGTTRKLEDCHPITPFDRYTLRRFGVLLYGGPIEFAPPSPESLRQQARTDLRLISGPPPGCLESPIWLAGIMHWLARSIVFWRDGMMMSKTTALEHEIETGSPFADAFAVALRLRREGSAAAGRHLDRLAANFQTVAAPAAGTLEMLIDG